MLNKLPDNAKENLRIMGYIYLGLKVSFYTKTLMNGLMSVF